MSAKTEDVVLVEASAIHVQQCADFARELEKMYRDVDTATADEQGRRACLFDTFLASHAAQAERIASLEEAGQAVVDRWDSPKWKDAEHTGVLIGRLRALLSGKASS